jgi:hypothetical protein
MKTSFSVSFLFVLATFMSAQGQTPQTTSTRSARIVVTESVSPAKTSPAQTVPQTTTTKPSRVVLTESIAPTRVIAAPTPSVKTPVVQNEDEESVDEGSTSAVKPVPVRYTPPAMNVRSLSFAEIKSKIAEARRDMMTRPMQTASVDPAVPTSYVRIAFYDWTTHHVDYVVMNKDAFLAKNGVTQTLSNSGKSLTVSTIRANGVNTPVTLVDNTGQAHLPLLVQYPVEKGGRYLETAYYMSTHPGLVTPEVVNAGRLYVRNVIEVARQRLKEKGIGIEAKVADMAERLATVEHVDHERFRNEPPQNIFNDIFTLYALNEGQTYRYSVSSAGAGGMVQMIPSTYQMMRRRYPSVGLEADFVEGMRNHVNATQVMLLYMQMTWNDLTSSPTISDALTTGVATPPQLMAAGYNSNPAKLAGYINRGGSNWTNLIPRETQMYLQIYSALERAVPMTPRTR